MTEQEMIGILLNGEAIQPICETMIDLLRPMEQLEQASILAIVAFGLAGSDVLLKYAAQAYPQLLAQGLFRVDMSQKAEA